MKEAENQVLGVDRVCGWAGTANFCPGAGDGQLTSSVIEKKERSTSLAQTRFIATKAPGDHARRAHGSLNAEINSMNKQSVFAEKKLAYTTKIICGCGNLISLPCGYCKSLMLHSLDLVKKIVLCFETAPPEVTSALFVICGARRHFRFARSRWRLFSMAQHVTPNWSGDKVDSFRLWISTEPGARVDRQWKIHAERP